MSATSQDEISLRELGEILRRAKWLIVAIPIFCAAVAGGIASMLPKVYEASIVVSPATDSGANGSMGGLASQLGGLASLAGLSGLGGTGKEESIAVLQSELLTERFISENNLLPVLFPETSTGSKPATLWRANEKFKKIRRVTGDRKSGLTVMTIAWKNPQMAADWANGLVRATNMHLRDKAIEESEQHIKYLSEQADKTDITVQVRSSIYSIRESEMKNVMQARGTAEYALRVIDPAVAPEKEAGPKLLVWIAAGFVSGLVVALLIAFLMAALRRSELRA